MGLEMNWGSKESPPTQPSEVQGLVDGVDDGGWEVSAHVGARKEWHRKIN